MPSVARSMNSPRRLLEYGQRRNVHQHDDVAADVPLPDREVDIEEHHHVASLGWRRKVEEFRSLPPNDLRQRHPQAAAEHVGDRAQAAVQEYVAGLGQCLLLQLDDVFEGKVSARDGSDELEALGLGKDQQGSARDIALEDLMNRDELAGLAPFEDLDGPCAVTRGRRTARTDEPARRPSREG